MSHLSKRMQTKLNCTTRTVSSKSSDHGTKYACTQPQTQNSRKHSKPLKEKAQNSGLSPSH